FHEISPGIEQSFRVEFDSKQKINCISLMEAIQHGQTIQHFELLLWNDKKVVYSVFGTTVGRKRILTFPEKEVTKICLIIHKAKGEAKLAEIGVYYIEE